MALSNSGSPHVEEQRLRKLWDDAAQEEAQRAQERIEAQRTVTRERLAYFERLALLNGGTIALVVSFVGARLPHLEPRIVLHIALFLLVLAMASAIARNWVYQAYFHFSHNLMHLKAAQKAQRARANYLRFVSEFRSVLSLQSGEPLDSQALLQELDKSDQAIEGQLKELKLREESTHNRYARLEKATHVCTISGMALLVVLSILNF